MSNSKLPDITKRQQEIIELIPQYRFLDSTHIQQILHHKYKREINRWLSDLTKQKYLERIYDNRIIGKNRISAIYYLGANGRKYLRLQNVLDASSLKKLSYEKDRSETFINHCLLLATICYGLDEKNSDGVTYNCISGQEIRNQDSPYYFLIENGLTTDLVFTKKQKGKKLQYFLLEIFDTTLPRYRLKKRIRNYIDFYFSNEWEDHIPTSFPKILLVFHYKAEMIYTKRYAKSLLADHDFPEELLIHTALVEDVKKDGVIGEIWERV